MVSGTRTKNELIQELRELFRRYDETANPYERDRLLAAIFDKAREVAG